MNERIDHLDGLRAISVMLVFCFHAEVLGATGGFLGVSVFFTLSGYLLALRLLDRPIAWTTVRAYWAARWRRILPASLTVLLVVAAVETLSGSDHGGAGRVLATALGLGNWLQVVDGNSYADLFARPDPLLHYWSLGIEEQVYLALPLVLLACLRRSARTALVVVAILSAVSFLLPVVAGFSLTRTYYGTDTRAGEILVGVLLALVHRRRIPAATRSLAVVGVAALAIIVGLAFVVTADSPSIRTGLLPLVAACSVLVLHAARATPRFAGGVLETAPMRWLGRLSYPVYLVHWPILVVFADLGWSGWPVPLLAAGLTIAAAWPLDRWVERPLRRPSAHRARLAAGGIAVAGLTAVAVLAPAPSSTQAILQRLDGPDITQAAPSTTSLPVGGTDPATGGSAPTIPPVPQPVPLGVFGDSLARSVARVIARQIPADEVRLAATATTLGCGLVNSVAPAPCRTVLDGWRAELERNPVEVALVVSCQWELLDRDLPGVGVRHVGQPEMDVLIIDEYRQAADLLLASGVHTVAWATCGELSPSVGWPPEPEFQASRDPARVAALNALIGRLAAESDGRVVTLDLAPFVDARRDDADLRPDGSHFEWDGPTPLADELVRLLSPLVAPDR